MRSSHGRNAPVRIPSAVLVELYRGHGSDEAIDAVLARGFAQVVTSGLRMARIAGSLLAEAGARSEMAIDALVVATAIRFGGGIAPPTTPTNYDSSPPPTPTSQSSTSDATNTAPSSPSRRPIGHQTPSPAATHGHQGC